MAKAKTNAAQAQPQEAEAADGEVAKTESAELVVKTNFTVVDNTNEAAGPTAAPEPGKAMPRKEKLNGFTVVDYV